MPCRIPDCSRPVLVKKVMLCERHYRRLRRHGDPEGGGYSRYVAPLERFAQHIERDGECDIWTGATDDAGYGRFKDTNGRNHLAHRWLYQQVFGTVAGDIRIRHDCDRPSCVRVEHLRAGIQWSNMQDMILRRRGWWQG